MRFGDLRSIGHNIADSLASGYSALVQMCELDVFAQAAKAPGGYLDVDFLSGTVSGGPVSPGLQDAVGRFRDALPELCRRHGVPATAFRQLRARYVGRGVGATFIVTVEAADGRTATDTYVGVPGARPRVLDGLGRIRTERPPPSRVGR